MESSTIKLPVRFRIESVEQTSDGVKIQMLGKGFESIELKQSRGFFSCNLKTFSKKFHEISCIFGPGLSDLNQNLRPTLIIL